MILLREPGASREVALPGYPVNLKREPESNSPGSELQLTYTLLRPTLEGRFNVRVLFRGLAFRTFRLAGTVLYTVLLGTWLQSGSANAAPAPPNDIVSANISAATINNEMRLRICAGPPSILDRLPPTLTSAIA
jgi:hypothetical protein